MEGRINDLDEMVGRGQPREVSSTKVVRWKPQGGIRGAKEQENAARMGPVRQDGGTIVPIRAEAEGLKGYLSVSIGRRMRSGRNRSWTSRKTNAESSPTGASEESRGHLLRWWRGKQ